MPESKDVYATMAPSTYTRTLGSFSRSTIVPRNRRRKKVRKVSFVRTAKINEAFAYLESKYDPEMAEVWDIYRTSIKGYRAEQGYEAKARRPKRGGGDHESTTHPPLKNKPGKTNWIEKRGGLPSYVQRVAKHIVSDSGYSQSRAIASAINVMKRRAAKGNAAAAASLARWNAMKGSK